jgi:hypothetical protein
MLCVKASSPLMRPKEVTCRLMVTAKRKPSGVCSAQRSNCSSAGSR